MVEEIFILKRLFSYEGAMCVAIRTTRIKGAAIRVKLTYKSGGVRPYPETYTMPVADVRKYPTEIFPWGIAYMVPINNFKIE